jgi:hypothetical protein
LLEGCKAPTLRLVREQLGQQFVGIDLSVAGALAGREFQASDAAVIHADTAHPGRDSVRAAVAAGDDVRNGADPGAGAIS